MSGHIWAPELHYIEGKWYIYFAAGGSDEYETAWEICMYVLENGTSQPAGTDMGGKRSTSDQSGLFSLDTTSFNHRGVIFCLGGIQGRIRFHLYIAEMSDPWTIWASRSCFLNPICVGNHWPPGE